MKITIITVSYNCESVIENCINSVNRQKNVDVEHIVIDGASTDGTLSILESKIDKFKVLLSEPDDGIYDAMNKGLEIATGDIIGFLNSDDFYPSNDILFRVASTFRENSFIDACYADLVYVNKFNTSKNIRYWKSNNFVPGSFSKGWTPPHPTFFVRNSIYKSFGKFDLNYTIAADTELMMRFLEVNKINVLYVPEIWVKMRMGGTSNKSIKNIFKQNKEVLKAIKKHNLNLNRLSFFVCKIFSRSLQFLKIYSK